MNFGQHAGAALALRLPDALIADGAGLPAAVAQLQAHRVAVVSARMAHEGLHLLNVLAGDLPSERIYEDEHTVAVMDINPWTRGHAVVIPRKHADNLFEIEDEELGTSPSPPSGSPPRCATRSTATAVSLLQSNGRGGLADDLPPARPRDPALRGRPARATRRDPSRRKPEELAESSREIAAWRGVRYDGDGDVGRHHPHDPPLNLFGFDLTNGLIAALEGGRGRHDRALCSARRRRVHRRRRRACSPTRRPSRRRRSSTTSRRSRTSSRISSCR